MILKDRGDLDGAMALLKKQEKICREPGNPLGLASSLANQALVLSQLRQDREALSAAEEAHRLADQHGYAALARQIQPMLGLLRRLGAPPPRCQWICKLVSVARCILMSVSRRRS
jgi:tetratricopeptide (TPR) repeat protein